MIPGHSAAGPSTVLSISAVVHDVRTITVVVHGNPACGSTIQFDAFVEAHVPIVLRTLDPNCKQVFPGISCRFVADNSTATASAGSGSASSATTAGFRVQIELTADVPNYYRSMMSISTSATCADTNTMLPWALRVQDTNGTLVPSDAAAPPGVALLTDGTVVHVPGSISSPTSSSNSGDLDSVALVTPPPGQAARAADSRNLGIFSFTGVGSACLEPLFGTWIAYAAMAIVCLVFRIVLHHRARDQPPPNTHDGIPQWRSLLIHHPYIGLLLPCHAQCVFIHAVNPLCHVLALIMSTAVLIRVFSSHADSSNASLWIFAAIAVGLAQPWKPLLHFFYTSWTYDPSEMKRALDDFRLTFYNSTSRSKANLMNTQELKNSTHSTSPADFDLANIEIMEEDEPDTRCTVDAYDVNENHSAVFGETTDRLGIESSSWDIQKQASTFELSVQGSEQSCGEDASNGPSPVTVLSSLRVTYGHIVNALFAILTTVITYSMVKAFGQEMRCDRFVGTLWRALLLDAVVMQSVAIVLTWMYRWMTASPKLSSSKDDDQSDDHDSCALWSELHPYHGSKRCAN